MYTEIKYLGLISSRLTKFKQSKNKVWNFRCPICGDSQRNRNKARGYVYPRKDKLVYKCHNCGISMLVDKLIEHVDPILYKEYKMEKFKESGKGRAQQSQKGLRKIKSASKAFAERMEDFQFEVLEPNTLENLTPIDSLNNSHPAKEYLLNRKLPTEALYFTEKFQEWVNSVKPDTFPNTDKDEPRIIIPFKDKEGVVFGFQGRSLSSDGLRYITILLDDEQQKIFGLNSTNYDERIYITEGPFDSLLLRNSVAMAGADISGADILGNNVVYIYDNEPRNKEINARIEKHINHGHSIVIWPKSIKEKDINDMVLAGHDVQSIVESNTYQGLTATLKFKDWIK